MYFYLCVYVHILYTISIALKGVFEIILLTQYPLPDEIVQCIIKWLVAIKHHLADFTQ